MRGIVAVSIAGAVFVVVAVLMIVRDSGPHMTTRTVVTPIVSSPLTPLQRRKAKHSSAAKSPDSTQHSLGSPAAKERKTVQPLVGAPQNRRAVPQRPKATTGTPKRRTGAQGPQQPTTTTSTQPSPQPQPQPGITVPLPSVCLPKVTC